ncbi:TIGR00268 family protein [Paenibacillus sp. MY03]|uniref:ATP-dependent sacrificial sulfur transferase LarE n=1 Tax=Paenibacillus sp. MY03 TaxID=302980 RepID=UPI000B3D4F1A|nr:ATP-dependent sacrificial sulfur transferase LarE [Paenibacillus sp. MY03]OUS76784.1 TIGR00268 family protein [Paenibacillus sp. MY03]
MSIKQATEPPDRLTLDKDRRLGEIITQMAGEGKIMLAYSGGVDSTYLLIRAHRLVGEKVVAAIAASETFPTREYNAAILIARRYGIAVHETSVSEFANPQFVANQPDRCYHCKTGLYSHLNEAAQQLNCSFIWDGSNIDDLGDYRPGLKAKQEQGLRSPLQEAGLSKLEIRQLSYAMGIPTWNKPSFACLSSRIPYGTEIDRKKIDQLDEAETYLLSLGFYQVRVRHHGEIARIEIDPDEMELMFKYNAEVDRRLRQLGFNYVTLDLQGYRTGSMNERLGAPPHVNEAGA